MVASNSVHKLLVDVWEQFDLRRHGRYVIIPNHTDLAPGESGDTDRIGFR